MRFILTSFRTELLFQLRRKRTWLLMLLLPAVVLAAVKLTPAEEAAAPVQVGVVVPPGDEAGEEYLERLSLRSGAVVTFIPADEETARRNVAAARWDCAILLPEDFETRLEELDTRRILTLITGPASVVYPVVQETAAVCLTEQIVPDMAEDYLLKAGIVAQEDMDSYAAALEELLPEEQRVLIRVETPDGKPLEVEALGGQSMNRILTGVVAILLLIWAMFAAMDLGVWLDSPFARRLRGMKPLTVVFIPRVAAALCPALVSAAAALYPVGLEAQAAALGPYLLLLGALALLCARFRAVWGAFPVLMPFVPVLCLLLSPVVFDLSALVSQLAPVIACMPVTLYLRTADGNGAMALVQVAVAGLLVAALAAADVWRDRRKRPAG